MIFIDCKSFRLPQTAQKWSQIDVNDRNLDDFSLNSRYFANQRHVTPQNFRKQLFHNKITREPLFSHFHDPPCSRAPPPPLALLESTYLGVLREHHNIVSFFLVLLFILFWYVFFTHDQNFENDLSLRVFIVERTSAPQLRRIFGRRFHF